MVADAQSTNGNLMKTCVFTNYRTGSSFLTGKKSAEAKLTPIGEYFNFLNYGSKNTIFAGTTGLPEDVQQLSYETAFRNFSSMKSASLKLMGDHVNHDDAKINDILDQCDTITYLYRRNYKAQLLSLLVGWHTGMYVPYEAAKWISSMNIVYRNSGPWMKAVDIKERIRRTYNESKTTPVSVTVTENDVVQCDKILRDNYHKMAQFYKTRPGQLMCLEDFDDYFPYKQEITWNGGIPDLSSVGDFDVEGLF